MASYSGILVPKKVSRVDVVNANSVWPGFTGTDFSSGYSSYSREIEDRVVSL